MEKANRHRIPVILGPTASGKTALSLELASALDAEIISADSRQIYRELDIGTAKPSKTELERIRHHFIDERWVYEPFDAGTFTEEATERIHSILSQKKRVVVVGGSTLYLQGLLKGFSVLPKGDPAIRAQLERELDQFGGEALYKRLHEIDPEQAATLDPTKTQRLIRSLEVIEITGQTMSELKRKSAYTQPFDFKVFGLDLPREILYERINLRTDEMMADGFLEEARYLFDKYQELLVREKINAFETVGYKELFAYLRHELPFESAVSLIKQHTRNYAKRQLTFFRNQFSVNWIKGPLSKEKIPLVVEEIFRDE